MALQNATRGAYRHLPAILVGWEALEGITQFFEGRVEELDVAAVGAVADEFIRCLLDLLNEGLVTDGNALFRMRIFVNVQERTIFVIDWSFHEKSQNLEPRPY